jgi:SAM-dependent methyltransferase
MASVWCPEVAQGMIPDQARVDAQNAAFWDELCGSGLALSLGITTVDRESLRRFDAAYMSMYPYLWRYLELDRVRGNQVLEIGLGYGTVGQLLAAAGAAYHGADIAPGPVEMMRERLRLEGLGGEERIQQASALDLPYEDASFDRVYTIGCLHHTGDLTKSVSEVHRVLVPGGRAMVMLYNRRSLRQLTQRVRAFLSGKRGFERDEWLRGRYDANLAGTAAPHVDYTSPNEARRLFGAFATVEIDVQNFDGFELGPVTLRRDLFLGNLARVIGLDLYIVADKA